MKVEIKKLPKSEVELTVEVPYEIYKQSEQKALEDLGKKLKIEGFRPGHVPAEIVREKVGEEMIMGATLDRVLPLTYSQAVQENNLQVVSKPEVDIKAPVKKEGDTFIYTAKVAVMPEVKVGDYKKIKVARKEVKVEPKQLEETLGYIMDRHAVWKDVTRKSQKGDRIEVSFEGFDDKGVALPNTASKNHPLILGSQTMVPGFEEALLDMDITGEKEFEVTFPKDYHAPSMQSKKVKFKATVHRIEEKMAQALDDAMVEKISGEKINVDTFKGRIEDELKKEIETRQKEEHLDEIIREIIKITKVELPKALLDQEIDYMIGEQKERMERQGIAWDQYLMHSKKTEDDLRKEFEKHAQERLTARLGIQQIVKDAGIEVSDDEVAKELEKMVAHYPKEHQAKVIDYYAKGTEGDRMLRHQMRVDKMIDSLSK